MKKKLFLILGFSLFAYFVFGSEIQEIAPHMKQELKTTSGSAAIVIESNVPKAEVYLNRIYQGKTKLTVKNLLPGQYILEVRKAGYILQEYYVTVKKGYTLFYKVDLLSSPEIEEEDDTAEVFVLENSN